MSFEKYHTLGIFLEINQQKTCYATKYECPDDKGHFSSSIKNKANFCPICGKEIIAHDYDIGKRYLNTWEIEKEAGIPEEFLFGPNDGPEEHLKYFSFNRELDGVISLDISDDNPFIFKFPMEKTAKEYIQEAYQNKEFKSVVEKLKDTYGEHFKIHFGVYTYVL